MNLLLDTHVILWSWVDDRRLGPGARAAISDAGNEVFASVASAWEIAIKQAAGRLHGPEDLIAELQTARFTPLVISIEHALAAGGLPRHHGDPFDRMLVAQAKLEGLTIVTADPDIARYDVSVMAATA